MAAHRFIAVLAVAVLARPHWSRSLTTSPDTSLLQLSAKRSSDVRAYRVEILRAFPHEGAPFTQGLEISHDGHHLVESSGSYPPGTESFIRIVDPISGATKRSLKDGLQGRFAEGIVQAGNGHWYMSTYLDKKLVEYSSDFSYLGDHEYPGMGWGLSRSADGVSLLGTNGSEHVVMLHKDTHHVVDTKVVTCLGKRVSGLNELEMVDNFMGLGPTLLGNVYTTRLVLAVDPRTARCTGVFSLDGLGPADLGEVQGFHVANGLAFNKTSGTLFATGKNWDQMFEVSIHDDPDAVALETLTRFSEKLAPADESALLLLTHNMSYAKTRRHLSQIPGA